MQADFKITLSFNFTCFTFYLSAIQTHTLDIPLSGMTTGIVIKFINTNGCLSSANMFSCFNSISTYLHRAPNNIWHIWHASRWSSLSANMFSCFNPIATNLPRIPTSTHFSTNLVNIFLRQNTIIHIIGSIGCFTKTLFPKKNKRNPPRISLGVNLKGSKRIFDFDNV